LAEWWLIDAAAQDAISERLNRVARAVMERANARHGQEPNITAALGERLRDADDLVLDRATVRFDYRSANSLTEENPSGADGVFVVTIAGPDTTTEKIALFQSKILAPRSALAALRAPSTWAFDTGDAERLSDQATKMLAITSQAVVMLYTPDDVRIVNAKQLRTRSAARRPLARGGVVTLGTYLGKWVARCTRGETDSRIVREARTPGGLRVLSMKITTKRKPVLAADSSAEVANFDGASRTSRQASKTRR